MLSWRCRPHRESQRLLPICISAFARSSPRNLMHQDSGAIQGAEEKGAQLVSAGVAPLTATDRLDLRHQSRRASAHERPNGRRLNNTYTFSLLQRLSLNRIGGAYSLSGSEASKILKHVSLRETNLGPPGGRKNSLALSHIV
jgi:hypothetical protein